MQLLRSGVIPTGGRVGSAPEGYQRDPLLRTGNTDYRCLLLKYIQPFSYNPPVANSNERVPSTT